ncbi:MAG: ABC transporter ATP-binding protein [Gemmatimonadota bacterium]
MIKSNGSQPVLTIDGLVKRYTRGALPAVADVGFTVAPGEVMAVVGESGCGKTTLLRLVAGLEIPDAGEIAVAGRTVSGAGSWVPPERRGVGMVFQDFALFPHMTTLENVVYGLGSIPRAERRGRAEEMLELVALTDYAGRYPHQLSGGQQQRVALARALAPQPKLLLLDEPFSNLDTALKRNLREELADILRRTGTTALLVVHDAEDVLALADRAVVMRSGVMVQEGAPDFLYRRPRNEYVAHFFGETNVLAGQVCPGGFETALGHVACAAAAACRGAVRLCLRPEDLQIVAGEGGGQAAIVQRVRYAGTRRRVLVALENSDHMPCAALMVEAGPGLPLSEGDRVFVRPKPDAVHVLTAD